MSSGRVENPSFSRPSIFEKSKYLVQPNQIDKRIWLDQIDNREPETMVTTTPTTYRSRAQRAIARIARRIVSGKFKPGQKLPSERNLEEKFGMNRTTVREALKHLEIMGLVEIRPKSGAYARDPKSDVSLEFVRFALSTGIGLDPGFLMDLAEIRRVFASVMVKMAAERCDGESLTVLHGALVDYPRTPSPERDSGEADLLFWRELARASKNRFFLLVINEIGGIFRWVSALYYRLQGDHEIALRIYSKLVAAIAEKDPGKAAAVFEERMRLDDETLAQALGLQAKKFGE